MGGTNLEHMDPPLELLWRSPIESLDARRHDSRGHTKPRCIPALKRKEYHGHSLLDAKNAQARAEDGACLDRVLSLVGGHTPVD